MYFGLSTLCVDCVLASPRIAQADPSQQMPPRGHSVTIFSYHEACLCITNHISQAGPITFRHVGLRFIHHRLWVRY
jgi:hypothetical protein